MNAGPEDVNFSWKRGDSFAVFLDTALTPPFLVSSKPEKRAYLEFLYTGQL